MDEAGRTDEALRADEAGRAGEADWTDEAGRADFCGRRVVMTGATGFIGRYTAAEFLDRGAEVFALVRQDSRGLSLLPQRKRLHLIYYEDMREAEKAAAVIGRADAFLHFAWGGVSRAGIDVQAVQAENRAASLACARAAVRLSCSVFMDAGSRVEYGITEDGRMEEHMACHPVNEYGRAKLAFYEEAAPLLAAAGLTFYHLRFFSVYGKGDHPWSIISTLTRELPQGKTVSVSACRHRWNFMEVRDAAAAVAWLYRFSGRHAGESHVINVAGRDTRVLRDFVEEIHEICGGSGRLEYGTFVQAGEGALSVCPETQRLKVLTEGRFAERISFARGIRELVAAGENEARVGLAADGPR